MAGDRVNGGFREAHVSAQQHQAEAQPRVPRSYQHPGGSQDPRPPSREGPQAARPDGGQQEQLALGQRNPRALRLRRTADYKRVQGKGRKVRSANLLVLFSPGQSPASRIGITVSRKVGNAVVRNRVKRWLREALRRERPALLGRWDLVLIAHPSAAASSAALLREEVRGVFLRLGRGRG